MLAPDGELNVLVNFFKRKNSRKVLILEIFFYICDVIE